MIVAGFGFRRGVSPAALRAALALAQRDHPLVEALATLQDKAPDLAGLAQAMSLPLIALDGAAIQGVATHTRSAASLAVRGTGSVAEAVALAAAGPGARLFGPRCISPDRTAACAIAEGAAS